MPRRGARGAAWYRQSERRAGPCWACVRRPPRRLIRLRASRRTLGARFARGPTRVGPRCERGA
eukprot:15441514-Alexandrium_andersonii.AAC.1